MHPLNVGRLAQLVQSTWFTPKGSGVRIPHRPQSFQKWELFFFMDFFVDILSLSSLDTYYVGATKDIVQRLEKYLQAYKGFTSKTKDWVSGVSRII